MVRPSELPIDTGATALEMAQSIFGDGATVVSASYTGDNRASGIYSDAQNTMPGVAPSDSGVILSTGQAQAVTNSGPPWWSSSQNSNASASTTTSNNGPNNLSEFNAAAGTNSYDASYLDVDFVPTGNVMTMQFVFASEEYPEYQTSQYQDFVGVWINGVQVELGVGDGDIDPRNLNSGSNQNLYVDNTADQYNTEMDGFTLNLTLTIPVVSGQVNSIRIGVADVLDSSYDSNLLVGAESVQTTLVALADSDSTGVSGTANIDALANDINATGGTLSITHINGTQVNPGESVLLATGQTVTLNPDGTLSVAGDGDEESVSFTYEVGSTTGDDDIGFITVDFVPCFVSGTRIDTPDGPRPVQSLAPGDLVDTRDHGPQPVRWIGRRLVPARDAFAPIRISAGALGDHGTLMVSPQHRILVQDVLAHLMFETPEVLAAAKHLVNGHSIRVVAGGMVEYVHILFDRHEIVSANGLLSESFLPGAQTVHVFDTEETLAEIRALFPELNTTTGEGYGPAARPILRAHEAMALRRTVAA